MKKTLNIIAFCFSVVCFAQSRDTIPERVGYLQHIQFVYHDELLDFTSTNFMGSWILVPGFINCREDVYAYSLPDGRFYVYKCKLIPEIKTINTINWLVGTEPISSSDSSVLTAKMKYNFVMDKFGEGRLNDDTVKKIRLLYPGSHFNIETDLILIKTIFYQDSIIMERKIIRDIKKPVVETIRLFPKEKKVTRIERLIKHLSNSPCNECFHPDLYPPLLEYYDGDLEHTYISSKKCLPDKENYKHYEKIIMLLLNLHPR